VRQHYQAKHRCTKREADERPPMMQSAVEKQIQQQTGDRHPRDILREHRQGRQQPGGSPQGPAAAPRRQEKRQRHCDLQRQQHGIVIEVVATEVVIGHQRGQQHGDQ
jgi:hypothetical protein